MFLLTNYFILNPSLRKKNPYTNILKVFVNVIKSCSNGLAAIVQVNLIYILFRIA